MKKLENLYMDLKKYSNFDEGENCEKFLDTVDKIVSIGRSESIKEILEYFDDDSDYSWVLQSMQKSIEHFEKDCYVKEIMKNLHRIEKKSFEWSQYILFSIFNDEKYLDTFKKNLNLISKNYFFRILNQMEKESEEHKILIQSLREEREKLPD